MSDEKVLTKEIAEQFLADEDSVNLNEFTAIEDAAAESLSKHEGELDLDGLTSLSDAAVESLSKHEGGILDLGGLTSLSVAAAEILSGYKGELHVVLKNLGEDVYEVLNTHPSMSNWGRVVPTVDVICGSCGFAFTFELCEIAAGTAIEPVNVCLERNDWDYSKPSFSSYYLALCSSCRDLGDPFREPGENLSR